MSILAGVSKLQQFWPMSAKYGQTLAEFGTTLSTFGQVWHMSNISPSLAQSGTMLTTIWQKVGPRSTEAGLHRTTFDRACPNVDQNWSKPEPMLAKRKRNVAEVNQIPSKLAGMQSSFRKSEDFGDARNTKSINISEHI